MQLRTVLFDVLLRSDVLKQVDGQRHLKPEAELFEVKLGLPDSIHAESQRLIAQIQGGGLIDDGCDALGTRSIPGSCFSDGF
jgi:hypothetical protein